MIIGIDPSLTRTGVATIDHNGTIDTASIVSKPRGTTIADRLRRLDQLRHDILEYTGGWQPYRVAIIEAPAYASRQGAQHDRSGLWWHLVRTLHIIGWQVIEVPPTVRAKYATGKGNAGKDEVLAAVIRRYCPNVNLVRNNDEADALTLAAIGARLAGVPIDEPMPKTHLAALAKLPALEGVQS